MWVIVLHRKSGREGIAGPHLATRDSTPKDDFVRRFINEPSHIRYVRVLPKLRATIYKACQEGWDTGVTAEMRNASYEFIDFLESTWLYLAEFYPSNHFGRSSSKQFIQDFIRDRFDFHWKKYEPDGQGTRGTMIGVMVGGDVIADLEKLIGDTVAALFLVSDEIDIRAWNKEWRTTPTAIPQEGPEHHENR
jgi:hypothetical protein